MQCNVTRDGEVTFEKELSYKLQLFQSEELGNFSYFSYSYHYKEIAQDVT